MEFQIGQFLKDYKPKRVRPKTRWQWIKQFYGKLYQSYNDHSPEPLTLQYLGIRLKQKVPTAELPTLWALCEQSDNFGKFFWWRLKQYPTIKKEKKPKQTSIWK